MDSLAVGIIIFFTLCIAVLFVWSLMETAKQADEDAKREFEKLTRRRQ